MITLSAPSGTYSLAVEVDNLHNASGQVFIALFDSKKNYPKKAKDYAIVKISEGKAKHIFSDLPVGVYAVSTFHDANSNKKLDVNSLGMPKENYGFSNNADARFGPPSFKKAALSLDRDMSIVIHLN